MRFLLGIILLVVSSASDAQHLLGLTPSNYAGTNALAHNPAFVADTRYKLYVNLVGNDISLINNYLSYTAPFSIIKLFNNNVSSEFRNSRGQIVFKEEYLAENLNGKDKRANMSGDLRGPSLLFTLNDKHAFALTSRMRYGVNIKDVTEPTARLMRYGPGNINVARLADDQHFKLNANGYTELGLTYGRVLVNDGDMFIKAGISIKRLVGMFNLHVLNNNASFKVVPKPNTPNKVTVDVSNTDILYGYTKQEAYENFSLSLPWFFGSKSAGGGWAADVGVVYEYRPDVGKYDYRDEKHRKRLDPSVNKYKYRLAVSLTDWGFLRYNNTAYANQFVVQGRTFLVDNEKFKNIKDINGIINGFNQTINTLDLPQKTDFSVAIPSSLQVSFDNQVRDNIYVNAVWIQNMVNSSRIGMAQQSLLAVTPRYESRWLELAVPLSLIDNYSRFSIGLAARLGPLTLGTDHLGGILNIGNPRGLDFYFNAAIPVFRPKPQSPLVCPPGQDTRPKRRFNKLLFWRK